MTIQAWLAVSFGFIFVAMIAGFAIWITARVQEPPAAAMYIIRVILALAAAGIGAVLPGMLDVSAAFQGFSIRAACGFGLFVVIYLINPPQKVAHTKQVAVGPVERRTRDEVKGP